MKENFSLESEGQGVPVIQDALQGIAGCRWFVTHLYYLEFKASLEFQ